MRAHVMATCSCLKRLRGTSSEDMLHTAPGVAMESHMSGVMGIQLPVLDPSHRLQLGPAAAPFDSYNLDPHTHPSSDYRVKDVCKWLKARQTACVARQTARTENVSRLQTNSTATINTANKGTHNSANVPRDKNGTAADGFDVEKGNGMVG